MKAIARIRDSREAANMTQEALAEKIGIGRTHISATERGVKESSLEAFVLIADALGTTYDELLK